MNAALSTEGKTITHSALSSRSCGILSGIFIISPITTPEFSRRSVSFSLSARAASKGAAVKARSIPIESSFLMSSFLLEVEQGMNRAGRHQHHMTSRIYTQCAGGRGPMSTVGCKAQSRIGNSHSFRVPATVWTIIDFPSRTIHGSGSMEWNRRLHALLVGCVVFGMVVCAGAARTAAQSRPSKSVNSRVGARNVKPAARADVERFRQRADAALSAAGPDKGAWGVLVTDAATGEVLYSRNSDGYFMPASNAKMFTTALALATLGPDYRVRTTVASSGTLDANGVLSGDLVLTGRGDANLSNRQFRYDKKDNGEGPPEKALAELAGAVAARGGKG